MMLLSRMIKSPVTALLFGLAACGGVDVTADDSSQLRCPQDGICFTSKNSKLLAGGFREGAYEIEFDLIYRPSLVNTIKGGSPYCGRIFVQMKHIRMLRNYGRCPTPWANMRGIDDLDNGPIYNKLARDLYQTLSKQNAPKACEKAWHELMIMAQALAEVPQ